MDSIETDMIIRKINHPSKKILGAFKGIPAANIADAMGKPSSFTIGPNIRSAFKE